MSENVEIIQTATGTPTPVTPTTPAKVEATATVSAPVINQTEEANKKQTAAFIKMRQEKRELKQQLAEAKANTAPTPAVPTDPAQAVKTESQQAPAPATAVRDIEGESVKAIEAMAAEKDVSSVPGAIMDIIQMVDTDPRLSSLHSIDPTLAFREAKNLWASKAGISATPTMPISNPTSGGMSGKGIDLDSLVAECEKHKPGTKEFNILAKQIREKLVPIHE